MKIAYVDYYRHGQSPHKDTLTIPNALFAIGCDITLVSCDPKYDGIQQLYNLPLLSLESVEESGWSSFGFSGVIFATRLNSKFTQTVKNICKSGLRLIIKADTDGTWGYPIAPNYLRARPLAKNPVNWLRQIKWRFPSKYLAARKLEQIRLADAVVVESPGAAVNAANILLHWGVENLMRKVNFIPNPVSPTALSLPLKKHRYDRIVTVGRWEDQYIKNTKIMLQVANLFLHQNKSFDFEIIGSGLNAGEVDKHLGFHINLGRVGIMSELPYLELQERLGQAKIILIPSTVESFCFVAAEALCAGASIATTPIESLNYLAGGGRWGSVARGFSKEQILAALTCEVTAWKQGLRDDLETSHYWRGELDPQGIAHQFINLLDRKLSR